MKAQCLCGAVSLEVEHNQHVYCCHCERCRTWASGAHFAVEAIVTPKITGNQYISRYQSSDSLERCFCKQCGTHVFSYIIPSDRYTINAGLFKENQNFHLSMQYFTDLQAPYYHLSDDSPSMTAAEFLAQSSRKD
ncbi:GFA family protein [Testudinibacter sp. TR-2022]|uniref:GFA family protein n=1 Tax=Testudinibacter sp. TR-2022 TaxID=2585029 RepID=UPI00111B56F1|nr:GFA family protein [Testudinibacter sp. TR-2022]TNH05504.1 GFA family protein [Pasteurellaceae bacterium Phil11]TNH23177.1 GFA family protein [Testudinibacter sp. TR-2022]TNH23647.1 GFA family protein [Testudinibacter sp. TR-2022]